MAKKSNEILPLLRMQSWTVDEQRRQLGQMIGREQALLEDKDALARDLVREQQVAASAPILAGHSYAAFALRHRERCRHLDGIIEAVRAEIEQQRERLAEAYRDLKVLEQVRHTWLEQEAEAQARLDQADMDEIAQNLQRRN